MTSSLLAKEPTGIGGWLLMVGLGLCLAPLLQAKDLLTVFLPVFTDGTFSAMSDPASEFYRPAVAALILFEIAINTVLLAASVWVLVQFLQKSPVFPRSYIALSLASIAVMLADIGLTHLAVPEIDSFDQATTRDLSRSVLAALIWIPYMIRSRRVRNTFVDPVVEPGIAA